MNSFSNHIESVFLPISESDKKFQVNHIYCVGRNYTEHAKEMGEDQRQSPFFFSKPNWTITNNDVSFPAKTSNLQHEVELVLAIGDDANIFGIAVGVDLTRRDLQAEAKHDGKPWFLGKNFIGSAPMSAILPTKKSIEFSDLQLKLKVNGEERQNAFCSGMIWSPMEILSKVAQDVPLQSGDLIFTGTPKGVASLSVGDKLVVSIEGKVKHSFAIV